jgi:tetratricopeptide (TPR) repeat protein
VSDVRSKLALVVAGLAVLVVFGLLFGRCGRSADALVDVGDRHLRSNRLVEAEVAYERALAVDPHQAQAIYGKGWAYYLSGHDELKAPARQLFQRAIDYDPDFYGGYRGMGILLLEEGQVLASERYLRQAWEKAPEEPSVLEALGQLYLRADRLVEAEQVIEAAVQASPGRGELRRFLADIALRRGDHDAALQQIEIGRGSAVGGRRGLYLLDEGEALIRLDRTRSLVAAAKEPGDPRMAEALQELERADSLLKEAFDQGFEVEVREVRSSVRDPVEQSLREKRGVDVEPTIAKP